MPGPGSKVDGTYNAFAVDGGELLAGELDRMAAEGGVKTLYAKVKYLTDSVAGQEAMVAAGISLEKKSTRDTVLGWLGDEELYPGVGISHANARRVEEAYVARRRETMAGRLKRRLRAGGGARIEVTPPDQSAVDRRHRRDLGALNRDAGKSFRFQIGDDTWDDLVDQWSAGDSTGMQDTWEGICDEHLYPPEAFYRCGDIQIAA